MTREVLDEPLSVLVTGGSGFLGHALVSELRDQAQAHGRVIHVRIFDRVPSNHGDEFLLGDITDALAVRRACMGMDVVFHCAAMIDWGDSPETLLRTVNLEGTRNVLASCLAEGVRALVHTSTMDVVFGGAPLVDVDESCPYPDRFLDNYGRFKAAAEQEVLAANGREGTHGPLRTTVLRPCGMYGERDPYHVSSALRAARTGSLLFRIGDGHARFEHVYVGNVAHAHAAAAFALIGAVQPPRIAGRCYFITDQPAQNFFDFMAPFVAAFGYAMPDRWLPTRVAWTLGLLVELAAKIINRFTHIQPGLTRAAVTMVTTWQSIDGRRLRADLAWSPRYSQADAFARTVSWFQQNPV